MENNSNVIQIPNGTVLVPLDQFTYMTEQATRLGVIEELIPEELADKFSTVQIFLEGVKAIRETIKWEEEKKAKAAGKAEPEDLPICLQPAMEAETVPACPDIEKVKALAVAGWTPADIACEFNTDAATVEKWVDQERRKPTDGNSK